MSRQQEIIDILYSEIISLVGEDVGNRVFEIIAPDNYILPLITFFVVSDQDEVLLGDGRIEEITLQISFFGKKSKGIKTLRTISDKFVSEIDGKILENGMTVKILNKGFTVIENINDENIMIATEIKLN